ncbi:MAG: inorganic diphosphatase [Terriglobales bacterium]
MAKNTIAAPNVLKPFDEDNPSSIQVVIETPKGSRNKYKFDPKLRSFTLSRVLPDGMIFPYDFGFVPSTMAEDGDPIDVLLLMDSPAFPGCVIESRLIGVIQGEQNEGGQNKRNDRLIAVANHNHTHSDLKNISGMNQKLLKEVAEFFVNYHRQDEVKYKFLGTKGPQEAARLLDRAIRREKAA